MTRCWLLWAGRGIARLAAIGAVAGVAYAYGRGRR